MPHDATRVLQDTLSHLQTDNREGSLLQQEDLDRIDRIMARVEAGENIGVLSVLITLLVKKVMKPDQDVRFHQANMPGGFSGRGLDSRHVTPFLRDNDFPHMASGSGWLTRSLEQASPYTLDYPGKIKPAIIKDDFLRLIDQVEQKSELARECLKETFSQLVSLRERSQNIALSRPKNKSIGSVVSLIEKLWSQKSSGLSRVPVIAVFAAYTSLVKEVGRYRDHHLLPLLPHNAADQKTGRHGDIDLQHDSKIVEAVEIKHGIQINPDLVSSTIEKVKRTSVKRYYILSTNEILNDIEEITKLTTDARINHGCEIIVNGVAATLKYYLRLVSNTDDFIENFVSMLEKDDDIGYETKMAWDQVANEQ
ncbi:MAG: hypothetical protein OXC38_02195 [Gammaproteobacteria bacterium]|nr:hypothetical protein [Gammaproteobacteria bacterium]